MWICGLTCSRIGCSPQFSLRTVLICHSSVTSIYLRYKIAIRKQGIWVKWESEKCGFGAMSTWTERLTQKHNTKTCRMLEHVHCETHKYMQYGLLAYDLGTIKYRKYFWSLILLYFIRYTYILILTADLIRWERNKHLSGQIKHRCWYGILRKSVLPSMQVLVILLSLIFVSKFHFPNQRLMCSEVLNKLLSSAYKAYCKQYTKC
jgi:hypothetical protein